MMFRKKPASSEESFLYERLPENMLPPVVGIAIRAYVGSENGQINPRDINEVALLPDPKLLAKNKSTKNITKLLEHYEQHETRAKRVASLVADIALSGNRKLSPDSLTAEEEHQELACLLPKSTTVEEIVNLVRQTGAVSDSDHRYDQVATVDLRDPSIYIPPNGEVDLIIKRFNG